MSPPTHIIKVQLLDCDFFTIGFADSLIHLYRHMAVCGNERADALSRPTNLHGAEAMHS